MRPILFAAAVFCMFGCASPDTELPRVTTLPYAGPPLNMTTAPARDPGWRLADERTFTFRHPPALQKQNVICYDSHCGEYKSDQMELNFDEAGFNATNAQRRHDRLAAEFATNPHPDPAKLIRNLNGRYVEITLQEHEVTLDSPKPPDTSDRRRNSGGYLALWIRFSSKADLQTAFQIADSLKFKTEP